MEFLVDDAVTGRHPLHVARADLAAAAAGIAMFQLALIGDGHGFKALVRMPADAALLITGRELVGRGVVEQQRTDSTPDPGRCNQTRKRTGKPLPTQCIPEL